LLVFLELTFDNFVDFLKSAKLCMGFRGQITGCISQPQLKCVIQSIETITFDECFFESRNQSLFQRAIQLPLGEKCVAIKSRRKEDYTIVVKNHYQLGILNGKEESIFHIITSSMEDFIFEHLRYYHKLLICLHPFFHQFFIHHVPLCTHKEQRNSLAT